MPISKIALDISANVTHSMALTQNGTLWSWGNNSEGQLGNGTTTNSLIPGQVSITGDIKSIDAGASHGIALKTNGIVWLWGSNFYGQLGFSRLEGSLVPIKCHVELNDYPSEMGGAEEYIVAETQNIITGNISNKYDTDSHRLKFVPGNYKITITSSNPNLIARLYNSEQAPVNPGFVKNSAGNWELELSVSVTTVYFLMLSYDQSKEYTDCPYTITITGDANPGNNVLELNCVAGKSYLVALQGVDLSGNLSTNTIKVIYDPQILTPKYVHQETTLDLGPVPGTNLTITKITEGTIEGIINKNLPTTQKWQGTISIIKFTAKENGITTIHCTQ